MPYSTLISVLPAALIAATLTAFAAAPNADAQTANSPEFNSYHPSHPYVTPSHPPTPPTSPMRHSSTVHEGVGRAVANIMRAHADQMLSYAQARILIDEAIAREMQLRVVNVQTHLEKKRLREEARDAARLRRWEWEQQSVARREQRQRTVLVKAYRLPASKLDPLTGKIAWPEALEKKEFETLTADLDALFTQLAEEGAQYDGLYRDPIIECCEDLRRQVWRNREALGIEWGDYLECQKLIVGLKYGAKYWPSEDGKDPTLVAAR
ncbi:MAG: hypothetical protein AAF589_03160 [Planctomycetota bacterium]